MADLDQTQAINLDDLEDETDEEEDNRPIAHLKVPCQKGFPERIFPLYEGDNLIGRQDTCNVFLPLKALSREHACIEIRGDNHMICDKNSRNRTRRGKMFLLPDVRYEIKHNDTLMFGDVNCVYLVGPQVNDGDDTGSETESESMFHTVQDQITDDEVSRDRNKVLTPKDSPDKKELEYQSDASSDMLEPTQPNIGGEKGKREPSDLFVVDMDSEQGCNKDKNLTVKETPAVGRTRATFTGTLILPESESETEDEMDKSDLLGCPTLAMEENTDTFPEPARKEMLEAATQAYITESDHEETDDSPSKSLFGAATQAYPSFEERSKIKTKHLRHFTLLDAATQAYTAVGDTDEESDASEILCETTVTNIDAAMDLGPTQAYSSFDESSPAKLKKEGKERLVEKKDEEEELVIEEEEEEENETVKNLFMSPTLACDNELYIPENEVETKKDSTTGKSDDDGATQVFLEDEAATLAVPSCDATQKVEEGEEATQVFETDEATQVFTKGITQIVNDGATYMVNDGATQMVNDDATQVFDDLPAKTGNKKADLEEEAIQVFTEDAPILAFTDATLHVVEKISCKSRSKNSPRNARTPKLKPNEATLVLLENNTTLPISDGGDATIAVSEEAIVAVNEDASEVLEDHNTHKGTILSSEDDPTQTFTAEETFLLLEVPDEKPVSGRPSRTAGRGRQRKDPVVHDVGTGASEGKRSTRGKMGKQEKETSNEETVTQAAEKVNDALSASKSTRKSGRKSTVAASRKSKGKILVEEATQAYGNEDDTVEKEEEITEVPFSSLKKIENPREHTQVFEKRKDIFSCDVRKKTEKFKPTQTFTMEVEELEKPTQAYVSDVTLHSPAFEPTHTYDMDVEELSGEEATQVFADEKDHDAVIKKIGKREQPTGKSSRKSKGSAEAAGDVQASSQGNRSRQRNIETTNKRIKVENSPQMEEATEAYTEDGEEDDSLSSLQEVIQKQNGKRNERETTTATSRRKRMSKSQEKVAETPVRGTKGNKQVKDKESDYVSDLLNLPAFKQAAPEATQAYGMEEDATPPLSADATSSPEAFLKSPIFPLPSTSPLKPALASTSKKQSPSPKCVTFAQEEQREKKPLTASKGRSTRRSLKTDLSKKEASGLVSIKQTRRGQTSKNSEESTHTTAICGKHVDGNEEEENVPKSKGKGRKSVAGTAGIKDQGEYDKVEPAETSKQLKRVSLQPEPAKTGLNSKKSRKSEPPPIAEVIQNGDSERRDDKVQHSLSGELESGDSKKRTSRSRGKTKDDKDKESREVEASNDTINQPTEVPDIEIDRVQEKKIDSARGKSRSQGRQSKDARAPEPEPVINNVVSVDQSTIRKVTHEKSSNSLYENNSRKSIRGKSSDAKGDTSKDTKTNNVRQDSIGSQNSLAISGNKAKSTRRRATIATGAAKLEQNNQPVVQFCHLKGRATRQKVGQIKVTSKPEKTTAPSHSHSKQKESKSTFDNTKTEEESSGPSSGSPEGSGVAGEKSRMKKGSEESSDSQETRGRKRGAEEPAIETPAKQAKAQDESFTLRGTRGKEESGINSPSLRRTSVAPTKPKVMFTGVSDDQGEKIVKDLGGELASSVYMCTHLVTDKIRRTMKLLCCLGRGVPIVSQTWLNSCKQSGMFIDPAPFLLQDSATEKQYKFSLQRSLDKAGANLMFAGYKVHVTKNVKPEPQHMKDILKCAGAQYLASMPKPTDEKAIVVSCDEDKAACTPAVKSEIPVVSAEFVLTGILRQEVDVDSLFAVPDNSRKRSNSVDTAASQAKEKIKSTKRS